MDPLRPFASLIRSLRSTGKTRLAVSAGAAASTNSGAVSAAAEASGARPVHARLRARLATLTEWNPAQARELFVECILLEELGAGLERDPAFADLVRKVGGQLASEASVSSRLDQLLRSLSGRPAA
jgi:hypothetical protein